MRNDLIICDWSGTISDDLLPVWRTNNLMLMKYGLPAIEFEQFIRNSSKSIFEYYKEQEKDFKNDAVINDFCQFFEYVKRQGVAPKAYDDASEFLEDLSSKNKLIAVVSSHPEKFVLREAEYYGFDDFFTIMRGGVYDKAKVIGEVLNELAVENERTVYIGDTTFDMEAAQRAEVQGFALCRGYHPRELLEKVMPKEKIFNNLIDVLDSGVLGT
ncbi:HAD family hydrolase [Candidatus Pacearchaeota archaeon]|nr:HAD family hydrolase [Candidatus Pacearchaeota archaeon]